MNCPHCGANVSPQAVACPHCAHPFRPIQTVSQGIRKEKTAESLGALGFIAVCIAALVVGNMFALWAGIAVLVLGAIGIGVLYFLA